MLSMKAKCALKALASLARAPRDRPILITDLARDERIPRKFPKLSLLQLKQQGPYHSIDC
jgi:DNA-binding IscR family transcriptional regulator